SVRRFRHILIGLAVPAIVTIEKSFLVLLVDLEKPAVIPQNSAGAKIAEDPGPMLGCFAAQQRRETFSIEWMVLRRNCVSKFSDGWKDVGNIGQGARY